MLTLISIDNEGRLRRSNRIKVPIKKAVPWSIDFALPQSVRLGEELIVDIVLTNQFHANCSQVSLIFPLFFRKKVSSDIILVADSATNGADWWS